jgi:hypothetical protein
MLPYGTSIEVNNPDPYVTGIKMAWICNTEIYSQKASRNVGI